MLQPVGAGVRKKIKGDSSYVRLLRNGIKEKIKSGSNPGGRSEGNFRFPGGRFVSHASGEKTEDGGVPLDEERLREQGGVSEKGAKSKIQFRGRGLLEGNPLRGQISASRLRSGGRKP